MLGKDLKQATYRKLGKGAWPVSTSAAVHLASVLRDLALPSEHVGPVLDRLLSAVLPAMDVDATPPFVYQLLLFASARASDGAAPDGAADRGQARLRVLRGVMDYYDGLDAEADTVVDGEVVALSQARGLSQRLADVTPARSIAASAKVLRAVEGTVLLHIHSAALHDVALAKDVVRPPAPPCLVRVVWLATRHVRACVCASPRSCTCLERRRSP